MKILLTMSLTTIFTTGLYASTSTDAVSTFNFSGLHPNTVIQSCQQEPCSLAKVVHVETQQIDAQSATVHLTLLGGIQEQFNKKITWNETPHKVAVHCSTLKPTIEIFDHMMPIYFMPNEPDLPSDVTLYLKSCHNLSHSNFKDLSALGYPLTTFIQP